jgi:hypothetical protein
MIAPPDGLQQRTPWTEPPDKLESVIGERRADPRPPKSDWPGSSTPSDRITEAFSLGLPRSEHSAKAEMLDMQEVTGSSPVSPTKPLVG